MNTFFPEPAEPEPAKTRALSVANKKEALPLYLSTGKATYKHFLSKTTVRRLS